MTFKPFEEVMYEEAIEVHVTRLSEVLVCAATYGYTAFLYEGTESLDKIAAEIRILFPDCRTYGLSGKILFDWTPDRNAKTVANLKNGFTYLLGNPLTPTCRNTQLIT